MLFISGRKEGLFALLLRLDHSDERGRVLKTNKTRSGDIMDDLDEFQKVDFKPHVCQRATVRASRSTLTEKVT